ncbi:unnamed protein product [Adineta steineri]|uniref:GDP-Man:Man(3)GlcNAc(2)-PP-Dol alpha-1,2-mannosyltransferase n=1 Tax=Adineta steineri TaxID=433720 RepID=A0A819S485_9BILA|nr:unnamed protein product [Adineta steineri]CAF1342526.1 unnamed protein product [Adineta steineri]CAF1355273.1 unnamed protein product [Adineta steineri]CAF3575791.1 unnamed protein product [Adineta steineri]CAF3668749.1 unnamed protein product [Adineta steineri]
MTSLLIPTIQAILFIGWGIALINLILLSAFTFFLFNLCLTTFMIWFLITIFAWILTIIPILKFVFIPWNRKRSHAWTTNERQCRLSVAFFHPYCNDGGGGERVLWTAIESILKKHKNDVQIIIYTGDTDATPDEILHRVKQRFDMNMQIYKPSIRFIYLRSRFFVEAKYYKMFTLLGQSIGSMILGLEALIRFTPDIYIDSMGYAFTYPIFRYLASVPVLAYVHYPTISTDMLDQVRERRPTYNNRGLIANNSSISQIKLIYYRLFAYIYGWCGRCAQTAYCNSSWTQGHIARIWRLPARSIHLIYPPCDVKQFLLMPLVKDDEQMLKTIVSIGQFRPEKDHELQIRSFHELLQRIPEHRQKLRLILIGSVRHEEDRERVEQLRTLVDNLNMTEEVEFKLNINFTELKNHLNKAMIGLHTMWNEHFGIGIVEMMAAGSIVLAHKSGGPKMDIVDEGQTGFLAVDIDSYATMMRQILEMKSDEREQIRIRARESTDRFSVINFEKHFMDPLDKILRSE